METLTQTTRRKDLNNNNKKTKMETLTSNLELNYKQADSYDRWYWCSVGCFSLMSIGFVLSISMSVYYGAPVYVSALVGIFCIAVLVICTIRVQLFEDLSKQSRGSPMRFTPEENRQIVLECQKCGKCNLCQVFIWPV